MKITDLYKKYGYFSLLFEKITDWDGFTDHPRLILMIYFMCKAMKKDTTYNGEIVLRGQYRTSTARLSKETGLSIKQVRLALKRMVYNLEITLSPSRAKQRTIVTLCNFEEYQPELLEQGKGKGKARAKVGQRYKEELKKEVSKSSLTPSVEKEILSLWKTIMPLSPQPDQRLWTDSKHRTQLKVRWNSHSDFQSVSFWENYFTHLASQDWMVGQQEIKGKLFFADFEYATRKAIFARETAKMDTSPDKAFTTCDGCHRYKVKFFLDKCAQDGKGCKHYQAEKN
jgi:hypothetical protein